MSTVRGLSLILMLSLPGVSASGSMIVDYTVDAGGKTSAPLNGLSARATFDLKGTTLSILLENTSTGVPAGFDAADSLLVSVGMNLPGVKIVNGDAALIGPGSRGIGSWSSLTAGDSVAEEWLWTNGSGGDVLGAFDQVISTSSGAKGSAARRFDGSSRSVNGPYGGIVAAPPLVELPRSKPAVSNSILFELTLSDILTPVQLGEVARSSIVEFGSDRRYLGVSEYLSVPEPTALCLAVVGLVVVWAFRLRRTA